MPKVVGFLAAFSLASAAFAASQPVCQCGPPTPESYKWNFSQEASRLLAQLHQNADEVRDSADQLETYGREPFDISWRLDATTLQTMRGQINHMDKVLCRLRIIERVLPAEQQAEINKITPATLELTDTAQAAITFLDKNEQRTWLPRYTAYAGEMYSEAGRIERYTANPGAMPLASSNTKVNKSTATSNMNTGS
jgi:hypothetical protein